jgi:hypothetical protein
VIRGKLFNSHSVKLLENKNRYRAIGKKLARKRFVDRDDFCRKALAGGLCGWARRREWESGISDP